MDIVTYALAKKIAKGAVSGISKLEVQDLDLLITTNDGNVLTMRFPTPTGFKLTDCVIDDDNHLIMTFTDGSVIDCGELPIIKGDKGDSGITPHIDPITKHWYIGTQDTGISAEGNIVIDSNLDINSENPIQNKVITSTLQNYATLNYVNEKIQWNEL